MTNGLLRQSRFTTFDGTLSLVTDHQRPDRYSHLESLEDNRPRIARGGGYAYSASSFGADSLVQEMTCFNRFLKFDPETLVLTVEAGVRLIDIMTWAIPRHMHLPVLPGYPLVTVGGCVAADVHGKNPFKDGTFADWVKEITLYHPQKGYQVCSAVKLPELFGMTCGGFGMTGIITEVTLQLAKLPAPALAVTGTSLHSLQEASRTLLACEADIAYSWHDACPGPGFGGGVMYTGHWAQQNKGAAHSLSFNPMTSNSRATLPFSVWNGITARMANKALLLQNDIAKPGRATGILKASFPFATNPYFHKLFGKRGLRETQFLVSEANIERCLDGLKELINATGAPTMMISLKRFRGVQQSLSMTGTGILVALDCFRNARTEPFMEALDAQILEFGAQPNLSKDSRLPGSIARKTLPGWVEFEQTLHRYDKDRLMRSELSDRLGLQ